jgi:integrase
MTELSPLRRRMIEDMTIRNLSSATQRSYISAVSKFSRHFGRSPDRLGLEEVRDFQVHLVAKGVSWGSLNQVVCALRFFYGVTLGEAAIPERIAYARTPRKLPVVLSADEVVRFLEAVSGLKSRAALTTAYAAGLRASEVAGLLVEDIDSDRGIIRVRHGKGAKDRDVMLSPQLLGILCQRRSKILPQGGAKPGHFGFGHDARHEAAASQPRSPDSWRLTGRLGPPGPIRRGSYQAGLVDLSARLCARR